MKMSENEPRRTNPTARLLYTSFLVVWRRFALTTAVSDPTTPSTLTRTPSTMPCATRASPALFNMRLETIKEVIEEINLTPTW